MNPFANTLKMKSMLALPKGKIQALMTQTDRTVVPLYNPLNNSQIKFLLYPPFNPPHNKRPSHSNHIESFEESKLSYHFVECMLEVITMCGV